MAFLQELGQIIVTTFGFAFASPFYWVVVFLIFIQHQRQAGLEKKLFGRVINKIWPQLSLSAALGAVGGFLASLVIILLGLSLEQMGLMFIWPVAILLLLVNPRFLCFAYAGGIVALANLLTKWLFIYYPSLATIPLTEGLLKIHVPALLALIALLHLVESLLIFLSGHLGSSPVYFKGSEGRIVGGFTLQRFWPIPLVALLVTVVLSSETAGVNMPEWWPVIKTGLDPDLGSTLQYMAVPVVAGLGYADLAVSTSPRKKAARSARYLFVYSIFLLMAAVAAEYIPLLILPGILLAPLGHEWVIAKGNRREFSRPPAYAPPPRGAGLMMVIPGSPADRAGLKSGDIILRVNGEELSTGFDLVPLIQRGYFMTLLEVEREGSLRTVVFKKEPPKKTGAILSPFSVVPGYRSPFYEGAELGIIITPPPGCPLYVEIRTPTFLSPLRRLFSMWGKK